MTLLSVAARINWVAKGNTCSSTIFFPCKHRKNWFELFRPFKTYNFVIELLLWDWLEFQDLRALKKSKMDFPIFCCIYRSIALFNFQKTELSKKPTKIFENSKNIFYIFFNYWKLLFSVFKIFLKLSFLTLK